MLPRFHVGQEWALGAGCACDLPEGAARHVQVLRMQPGDMLRVFDGAGGEWLARVTEMGRKRVSVEVTELASAPGGELPVRVTLAIGMPANDRMDDLVEKATELGVHQIQPLVCERSVLRLDGERAAKKVAHWQAVAVAGCEQSGRAFVPRIEPVRPLRAWLQGLAPSPGAHERRGVLSLRDAVSLRGWLDAAGAWRGGAQDLASSGGAGDEGSPAIVFLSGPEGGLSPAEEQAALDQGWNAITLGRRVLRADTAPLAALGVIACAYEG